jgi:hypothetical protein
MSGNRNPYGVAVVREPGAAPGAIIGLVPNPRYAVPDVPETTDEDRTWAIGQVGLFQGPQSVPSDIRMGTREPPLNDPNDREYLYRRESDQILRRQDEQWDVLPHDIRQGVKRPGVYPDQVQAKLPTRPTADDSPNGYKTVIPKHHPRFIQDALGENAEDHISLADHRRAYPVNTMVPRGKLGVNTYRRDPRPWDEDLIVTGQPSRDPGILSSASGGNRAWRL